MELTESMFLAGYGAAIPDNVVLNGGIARRCGVDESWILQRTGVLQRNIVAPGETTATLGSRAATTAIQRAGLDPLDIDAIVCATVTPDYTLPSAAVLIQHQIGARRAFSFDISAACAGFVYGIHVAGSLLSARSVQNVLLVCADTMSSVTNWTDPQTACLFGDGASALVVSRKASDIRIVDSQCSSDGEFYANLIRPVGGSAKALQPDTVSNGMDKIKMSGRDVFRHSIERMYVSSMDIIRRNHLSLDDIDLVVPHQANERIISALVNRLGISPEKVLSNIAVMGNTGAASIPLVLCDVFDRCGSLPKIILCTAFGGGYVWGSLLLQMARRR